MIGQPQGTAKNGLSIPSGGSHTHTASGSFARYSFGYYGNDGAYGNTSGSYRNGNCGVSVTVNSANSSHTHSINSDDIETKPNNLTYKIWVRTN